MVKRRLNMEKSNYEIIKDSLSNLSEKEADELHTEIKKVCNANFLIRCNNPHKELIESFKQGAKIQYYNELDENWLDLEFPKFDKCGKYRIKPELVLVPFDITDRKSLFYKMIKRKELQDYSIIVNLDNLGVWLGHYYYNYTELLKYYEFENGEPCGKYVELIK